ncbi:MAG: hypothetical protein V3U40_06415 [Candidatus Scalindua sediminis]
MKYERWAMPTLLLLNIILFLDKPPLFPSFVRRGLRGGIFKLRKLPTLL